MAWLLDTHHDACGHETCGALPSRRHPSGNTVVGQMIGESAQHEGER
jgi:hypothetical protein